MIGVVANNLKQNTACRHLFVRCLSQAVNSGTAGKVAETFKGWLSKGPHHKLEWGEYTPKPLEPMDVDIAVTHNGLCHTDVHMRDDDWGITTFPFVPGHEVVGKVVRCGGGVKALKEGDRVGVGWIADSCRACSQCLKGNENLCAHGYRGLIVGGNGGFQPIMRAPADFCYKLPDTLDSAVAAPLLCAGITVYAPLKRCITKPGTRVGVLGVGGLGHLGLQYAAAMGAHVTAIDMDPNKAEECKKFNADEFKLIDEVFNGPAGLYDVILNTASGKVDNGKLLRVLKNDGSLIQAGIPGGGAQISLPLQDLVFGQKKMVGTIVGGRADMQEMLEFSAVKNIAPMLELMPLSKINEAMDRVAAGKARYRIVLTTDCQ